MCFDSVAILRPITLAGESDCIQHGTQSKTKPVRPLLLLQGPETQALLLQTKGAQPALSVKRGA